jgi:hypothetical protein
MVWPITTYFFVSLGWEVVQSAVHQTLTLIILVRVQASQPNVPATAKLSSLSLAEAFAAGRFKAGASLFVTGDCSQTKWQSRFEWKLPSQLPTES